jgi:O-antigen ligase
MFRSLFLQAYRERILFRKSILKMLPPFGGLPLSSQSTLALAAVCLYTTLLALPLKSGIPLVVPTLLSLFAVITRPQVSKAGWSPLALLMMTFLVLTAISTMLSVDIGRSVRFSKPLLPAVLLFFLVAEYFDGPRDIHLLYRMLSVVGLMLASTVLWEAWHTIDAQHIRRFIVSLRIPLLVVPNDVTFLAMIVPLSLVLVYREPRTMWGILAVLSLVLSVCAICVLKSRTAALVTVISLLCVTMLTQTKRRLLCGLIGILLLVLAGLLLNSLLFPESQLVAKVVHEWGGKSGRTIDGRTPVWAVAWSLFTNAPVLGHGAHTFGVFHPDPQWVHNLYLEALAEQGLLGFMTLGCLLAAGLSVAWKLRRVASRDVHLFGAAAFASLVGFCSAAVVELSFIRLWVVITLFVLLGVIARLSSSSREEAKQ